MQTRGFTLVEVLVALVITSLLVSILMGSLYYLFRVEDSLRDEIVVRESELRSKAWFGEIVGGCLPAEGGSGSEFVGRARELVCDTVAPLRPQEITAPQRITLSLQRGKDGSTELTYREQGGKPGQAAIIAVFPEGDFQFVYVGIKKNELDTWPLARKDPETLPRRVLLRIKTRQHGDVEWMALLRADPWLEPIFKNPFGIDPGPQ